jgi:tight adherence protein B
MKLVVALLAAATAGGIALLVAWAFAKHQARIERRLAGYEPITAARAPMKAGEIDLSADSKVGSQAIELTRELATRAGILAKVELMLEQANVPIRPAEFLFYVPVVALAFGGLVAVGIGWLSGLVVGALFFALPVGYVKFRQTQRLKAFDEQLPDALHLLASSMRAGFSFMQGVEAVASEAREPMKRELHRVFTEARLGRAVDVALEDCATRMASKDLEWVVMALRIQREVGGNLAELLVTVADTMTQRERLRREVRALTAEGRFSAYILSAMPFFFLLVFQILSPDYVPHLFHKTLGIIAVVGAGLGNVVGWFWLQKIVKIEV